MLFRKEFNVQTGEEAVYEQIAYRNSDGDVLVLDAGDPVPGGYDRFEPSPQ